MAARLQERRGEIEQAALTRAYAVADPTHVGVPEYAAGLRAAVSAAFDYGLISIERGEERAPPPPTALLAQTRLAARHGVSLETVLRRCFAGYTLLGDFLMQEAEQGGLLGDPALQRVLRTQAAVFDRLIAAVTEEHTREASAKAISVEERRADRIKALLAGELLDTANLRYSFDSHHLGLIAAGPDAVEALRHIAGELDCCLLWARHDEGTVWAWLGARSPVRPKDLKKVREHCPGEFTLAAGEPAEGLAGWRLTHRQARAALPIALRKAKPLVRYRDVALLAAALRDDLLIASLQELYLEPLERERDAGKAMRETLCAYFQADRNVSSAAAKLGVNRNTVASRLRAIETAIGRPLNLCSTELEIAMKVSQWPASIPTESGTSLNRSADNEHIVTAEL